MSPVLTEPQTRVAPVIPEDLFPPSTREEMDRAVAELDSAKAAWVALPAAARADLLAEIARRTLGVADAWAEACALAEGLTPGHPAWGEEALVGPYFMIRNCRLLEASLRDLAAGKKPRIPGRVRTLPDGRVSARVFPFDVWDRLFYTGVTADVWMQDGVTEASLPSTQAVAYDRPAGTDPGGVALVLGGGNVSSIGPMDALYKLFAESRVVLLKMHPLNAYLGPIFAEVFAPLIERGFVRITYGGAAEGAYLAAHPRVDELHITGSDKTYDAIVYGPGEEGRARKKRDEPINSKPFSAELGNVSPVIVVPGPWSAGDLAYHAENVVTMLTNNAGFNCNAARVLVTWKDWPLRDRFLGEIRRILGQVDARKAYYPGAADRFSAFAAAHPEMERYGEVSPSGGDPLGRLPWGLIARVAPERRDDVCFTTEAFCGVFCETALAAATPTEFMDAAVRFSNETLWGTLNATLLIHPASRRDRALGPAIERAIRDLRYGTVAINHWAAIGYGVVVTPWGAYPGHDRRDIRSGSGFVHNTPMFSGILKTVFRAPFRVFPKPVWFATHKTGHVLTAKLCRFEAAPSLAKLPGIFALALRG